MTGTGRSSSPPPPNAIVEKKSVGGGGGGLEKAGKLPPQLIHSDTGALMVAYDG